MATPKIRMLCFAAETFPTHRVDVDVLFGRELAGRGHAVDFVMQAAGEAQPAGPRPWNGRTVFVGETRDGGGALDRVRRQTLEILHDLRCLGRARRDDYDAIQVRDKFLIAAIAALVARSRGLRFFFWMSFPMPEADVLNARSGNAFIPAVTLARGLLTGWLLYRWILPRADHVFVQSERMKIQVALRGIDPSRITPVPMGVDLESLPAHSGPPRDADLAPAGGEAEARQPRSGSDVVIGYLGTLDASRRLEILVEMLALLRRDGVPVRLLLIGDAVARRDRDALSRLAAERGVESQLEITGMLPRAEAMRRMSAADIAVSPILRSPIFDVGSPTKLVEYMALGIPVVANSHPEQRLILGESRAGVCVPWSARHFARGVRWLMQRPPGEIEAMGRRGRHWVLRHRAYPVLGAELEQRYLQLLATGAAPAPAG